MVMLLKSRTTLPFMMHDYTVSPTMLNEIWFNIFASVVSFDYCVPVLNRKKSQNCTRRLGTQDFLA